MLNEGLIAALTATVHNLPSVPPLSGLRKLDAWIKMTKGLEEKDKKK